ncbi:unnamed protein product [Rangifer tarandus platyrhynchus]|uniref:Uncharacterized protein n=2 Tax=Rangifer tarandus platyrhynchus TaxID=3082113 RepID=A0ABN8XP54_RANTA|nr:unnamed protein product [Rangifer tarandus platyrhynchus]CAI9691547.1 unnamed protein product [Rangifer tarandus platyrhynchus]
MIFYPYIDMKTSIIQAAFMIPFPLGLLLILQEITMQALSWAPPKAGTMSNVPVGERSQRFAERSGPETKGRASTAVGAESGSSEGRTARSSAQVGPPGAGGGGLDRGAVARLRPLEARFPERARLLRPACAEEARPGSQDAAHTTEGNAVLGFFLFAYNYSDGIIFFETNCP